MQAVRLIAQKRRADGIDKRLKRMPFVAISRFQKPSDVFGKGEQLAIAIRTRSDLYIRLIAVQCDISAAPPGKQPFFRAVHFIHLLHGKIAVRVSPGFPLYDRRMPKHCDKPRCAVCGVARPNRRAA